MTTPRFFWRGIERVENAAIWLVATLGTWRMTHAPETFPTPSPGFTEKVLAAVVATPVCQPVFTPSALHRHCAELVARQDALVLIIALPGGGELATVLDQQPLTARA
jgi:hypothetical protein